MAVNDIWRLSVQGTVFDQDHIHTLHFRNASFIGSDQLEGQTIIDEWQANCRTQYRAFFASIDTPVQLLTARKVCGAVPLPAPVEETEAVANSDGTQFKSTERGPSWLACVTSVRTGTAGRRYRGRYFLGGLFEEDFAGNQLSAFAVSVAEAYAAAVLARFGPTGGSAFEWFVYSRLLAAGTGNCQDFGDEVIGTIVRPIMGSMKSRKPGSGS